MAARLACLAVLATVSLGVPLALQPAFHAAEMSIQES